MNDNEIEQENGLTIGELRDYVNQLPEEVMKKEVWIGSIIEETGISSQCSTIRRLDMRSDTDFDILLN